MPALLFIFLALPLCIVAEEKDCTAEEIVREADRAFAARRWSDAVAYYEQFLRNFASAPPAKPLLSRIHRAIVRCHMNRGDFVAALPAIQNALEADTSDPLRQQVILEERLNLILWKGIAQLATGAALEAAESFAHFLELNSADLLSDKKREKRSKVFLLRAHALIQAGKMPEAIQWLEENDNSNISEDYRTRLKLLKIEALISGGESARALAGLLQMRPPFGEVKLQLLTVALAQNLMNQEKANDALRALSRALTRAEILKNQNTKKAFSYLGEELFASPDQKKILESKEFEKIQNWDDSILLLRANAFLHLQRYREAALALEGLQNPGFDEFMTALRCWLLVESPHHCLNLFQKWRERFSESPKFSLSQLLVGTAFVMLEDYETALHTFRSIPSGEFAESARVQEIKTLLLAQKEEEAIQVISGFTDANSPFLEEVLYLKGIALSNSEKYDACRESMNDLLQRFPKGERAAAACFLRASAAYRKMDFAVAITELRQLLQKFPDSPNEVEAWLLLGDAFLDQRKIAEGLAAYRKVSCSSLGLHEIAIFRLGKTLKKLGRLEESKKEMENFCKDHPGSNRLPEAIREIGQIYQEQNKSYLVDQLYWEALEKQGANPSAYSVEIILQDLQKLSVKAGKLEDYGNRLMQIREKAFKKKQNVLGLRIVWAQSRLLKDPLKKAEFISPFITEERAKDASPRILADFADFLFAAEKFTEAKVLYRSILKWHPAAEERDRALAGLAQEAWKAGDFKKSLAYWDQLLEEKPESRFVPEAQLVKAGEWMKKENEREQAILCLKKILQHDLSTRTQKVEALYYLGEIYMKKCEYKLAIPYFQRIYIAYGIEKKWVAQAYLSSATAFELLGDVQSMVRTYEELISREDLKQFPEFHEAQQKLTYAKNSISN